jgi:membrane protease YdiL (CAAX protease family)
MTIDIRERTIFTLPTGTEPGASTRTDWVWSGAIALLAWVGALAYLGRYRPNQVAEILYRMAPSDVLFWGALGATLAVGLVALATRRRAVGGAALVFAAFLAGHPLLELVYTFLPSALRFPFRDLDDGLAFARARFAYGLCVLVPMLLLWALAFGRGGWPPLALGVGDWRVRVRDLSVRSAPAPAWRELIGGYAVFCAVLFLLIQASVGFQPLLRGTLWPVLPAVLVAAAANGLVEELVFRGVLQPALIRAGGLTAGLWVQGLLFGLMHWGLSVGMLAALPTSLLIGFGSVMWGKYALDTRGLAWVVVAHAMIDVAVMAAYFVPRS